LVISGLAITREPDAPDAAVTIFGDTAPRPASRWLADQAAPLPGLGAPPHRAIGRISMTARSEAGLDEPF